MIAQIAKRIYHRVVWFTSLVSYCPLFYMPARLDDATELLDEPLCDRAEMVANLADIRDANRLLNSSATLCHAIVSVHDTIKLNDYQKARNTTRNHHYTQQKTTGNSVLSHQHMLLDVATGSADIPLALQQWLQQQHMPFVIYASDVWKQVLDVAHYYTQARIPLICHNALHLPYADDTFDIVTCVQALHHFNPPDVHVLLREMARVARHAVIIHDLTRSCAAYWGAYALGIVQRSDSSRHDGPLSVQRAYTAQEALALAHDAGLHAHIYTYNAVHYTLIVRK